MTALLCCLAAAGRLLPLCRAAMIFRPLLLGLILAVALLTAKDLDLSLLLPLSSYDLREASACALEVANMLSVGFFLGFFGGQLTRPLRVRDYAPWLGALLTVVALMTVGCLGMFGPELTACLSYPYFMLVRDLTVLGALERVEPVVIALWVFSDFLLISLLLRLSAQTLRFSLGLPADGRRQAVLPLLCTLAAAAAALALPGKLTDFCFLSETLVPLLSALFGFSPLPLLLLIAALRKKL